jgi:hypothetical protein
MTLFVYITESCRDDASTHGMISEVDGLRQKVEEKQNTSQFDRFPSPYLVKKKLGSRQGRLIAEEREIGEHVVIVFLAVMIRGSREYASGFGADPQVYGETHFRHLVDQEKLADFVEARTSRDPVTPKQAPSDEEYSLLYTAFADPGAIGTGAMVFETREWVDAISQDRIAKQLPYLTKPVTNALSGPDRLSFHPVDGKKDWGVWAYRADDKVVLMTPSTDGTAAQSEEVAKSLALAFDAKGTAAILRASRRAYPQIVLADDELWLDLEREREANLALSPEESQVLESTRGAENPFPLFINGRAGSGKSTILQYLFANFLHNYRRGPARGKVDPPIYLTANAELLRVARGVVERLLRKEMTLGGDSDVPSASEVDELLDPAFREFYAYVASLVPGEARKSRFARSKRLDYTGFRARWMERFGKDRSALRDFGPDVSWHVIRTFIKGRGSETFLEPEDYEQLPENECSVTLDGYRRVFDRVWQGWYLELCETEGYWDDQDLVRYVLEHNLARATFPAVFCDEAQDFTRLELELLLRINTFSQRTLPSNDLSRVCFVFAGDQFQTLNPTGFRWDAIKATFVEKFILELDPGRRSGRMDLNYRELEFNYRSARRIVRFSNLVQALRAALFAIPDLRPQTPWLNEPREFPVVAFRNNDGQFWKRIRENAGWIIIVPCADGEELRYVQADSILRDQIRVEDGVPQNVLSASRAKGCEYADVVVYGFGATLENSVIKTLRTREQSTDAEKNLSLEYFINRLYVAVSRAKRRLVIVDSNDGFEKLWTAAHDDSAEAELLASIKNGQAVWLGAIEGMTWGVAEELARDAASDPRENAVVFERDGLARRDAFLMRQAGQSYRAAGDEPKARECRAKAFEFDLQYMEAGAAFAEAGDAQSAVRCYWMAGKDGWGELTRLKPVFPDVVRELEYGFAAGILLGANASESVSLVEQLVNRCVDPTFAEAQAGSAPWRDALSALLRGSFGIEERQGKDTVHGVGPSKADAARMSGLLGRAKEAGVIVMPLDDAAVNFYAERFAEAAKAWEAAGSVSGVSYSKAKAYSDPYPQRVVSLARRKEWSEIVDAFRRQSDDALTVEQANAIVEALTETKQFSDALQLGWRTRAVDGLLGLADKAWGDREGEIAERALHASVATALMQYDWDVIEGIIDADGAAKALASRSVALRAALAAHRTALRLTFVRAFARSGALTTASENVARKVTDFLRETLRVKDGEWRKLLSVEEAGAAIERAGRFTDALSFYDAIRKQAGRETDQEFARRRRLVALQRQLTYEKSKRESGQTRQLERDLRQAMASQRVSSISELGEFPMLPPLELGNLGKVPTPASGTSVTDNPGVPVGSTNQADGRPDKVAGQIGEFNFEVSRSAGRLNITRTETLETAYVKLRAKECGGEGGMQASGDGQFSAAEWGLTVRTIGGPTPGFEIGLDRVGARLIFEC